MTTEKVSLDLSELQKIEVLGLPFGYKSTKNKYRDCSNQDRNWLLFTVHRQLGRFFGLFKHVD